MHAEIYGLGLEMKVKPTEKVPKKSFGFHLYSHSDFSPFKKRTRNEMKTKRLTILRFPTYRTEPIRVNNTKEMISPIKYVGSHYTRDQIDWRTQNPLTSRDSTNYKKPLLSRLRGLSLTFVDDQSNATRYYSAKTLFTL